MKISAIIPTNGSRKQELDAIVSYITPFFDEIIIQKDTGSQVYTRYEGIMRAKNDVIYTQDDDCIVENLKELLENYEKGVIVANSDSMSRVKYAQLGGNICLVGYGSVFDKNLINVLDGFKEWMSEKDVFYRECDRVFTWLNKKKLINGNMKHFISAYRGISSHRNHEESLKRIIDKLKEYENTNIYLNSRR
jgi:hypothetical protein